MLITTFNEQHDTFYSSGVYWATFSNEIIFEVINAIPQNLLQPILITADGILRGIAVAKVGVDGVRLGDIGPGKYVAMLLCGTLCGGGGGIWAGRLHCKMRIVVNAVLMILFAINQMLSV